MVSYKVYCELLDYIGDNYHRLNDQTLTEDWWSDLSPPEQAEYIKDHPDSKKAKTAREKEKKADKDEKSTSEKPSKEKTQQTLKDLKTHVGDVAKNVGVDAKVVAKAFKEPSVYNTVNALGGSLSAASKTLIGSARAVGKVLDVGGGVLSDTESFKKLEKGVVKVDEFMDKNPALKRIGAGAVAGIAAYQWLNMSFSGDIESDYDTSLVVDGFKGALTGKGEVGFADLINTPDGVKGMALLAAGLATGGLPIWMSGAKGLGMALAFTGAKQMGDKESGKKIKEKMVAFGNKAKEKVQKGAKGLDKKLGVEKEEKMVLKTFSQFQDQLDEIMSVQQRKKQARRMAKMARSPAMKAKKAKARLRMRPPAKLIQIARKKTIQAFRDKFYPQYNDSSLQQRVKIDQMVMAKYGPKIDKLSKKMVVKLKKKELERVKAARANLGK